MLMLAKLTLLAVMLFIVWPNKCIEVCTCDLIYSYFSFTAEEMFICQAYFWVYNLQKKTFWKSCWTKISKCAFNRWASKWGCQVIFVESSSVLWCVQSCDSEKILSIVSLWHIIIADHLACMWYGRPNRAPLRSLHLSFTCWLLKLDAVIKRGSRDWCHVAVAVS